MAGALRAYVSCRRCRSAAYLGGQPNCRDRTAIARTTGCVVGDLLTARTRASCLAMPSGAKSSRGPEGSRSAMPAVARRGRAVAATAIPAIRRRSTRRAAGRTIRKTFRRLCEARKAGYRRSLGTLVRSSRARLSGRGAVVRVSLRSRDRDACNGRVVRPYFRGRWVLAPRGDSWVAAGFA